MTTSNLFHEQAASLVALAVAALVFPVQAQQVGGGIATLPENSVSIGLGVASGEEADRARFGLFNGLRKHDANLLFGFNYTSREEASGRWMSFEGRNIGLDNRELSYTYRWLGDLKFTADYGELVRHDPRTINTSLSGAGTPTPVVTLLPNAQIGQGQDLNLELKRKALGLGFEKMFGNAWQLEVAFKHEDKSGARFFGRGFGCAASWRDVGVCSTTSAGAVLMLPEPVDSTIRQLDAKLNYSGPSLKLSAGYYGSFYTNHNGFLRPTIVGGLQNQNAGLGTAQPADANLATYLGTPMALWPDNQAHQLFVAGNYKITPKTKVNFKYAYTHATQNESFTGMGLTGAPAGRNDLGGGINTTKAQIGFSAHPLDKLHLHGDVAYDHRKNETPLALYNQLFFCTAGGNIRGCTGGAANTVLAAYTNGNASPKKYDVKLEASYKLPQNYLVVGGLKYEREDFGTWTPTEVAGGVTGLKQKLAEESYRLELRKTMSDTLTGSISLTSAHRKGKSPWLRPVDFITTGGGTGVVEVSDAQIASRTAIFPFIYMDRKREKVRLIGNWEPVERLSLQVFWDNGKDTYSAPTEHGLRSYKMDNVALDAAYAVSDAWRLNAYVSRGTQTIDAGHSTGYDAIVKDTATSFGVGFSGTPTSRLRIGGDLTWLNDKLAYQQTLDPFGTSAANAAIIAAGGLPDVTYRLTRLNVFGEYALQKSAHVRLDFIHVRTLFNEWTYNFNGVPYLYSDNTTLNAKQNQSVSFLGASYVYRFQ